MTLSQIMTLALRQLDEDAQDLAEYESAFRVYANIGYDIAVREHLRPRQWIACETDEHGALALDEARVLRVVAVKDEAGEPLAFRIEADGSAVLPRYRGAVRALCEVSFPEINEPTDEPLLPLRAHHALADYICYRHLSSGSMAKQAKAQFFLSSFYDAMRMLRPQGMGSAPGYRNLYAATDLRAGGR